MQGKPVNMLHGFSTFLQSLNNDHEGFGQTFQFDQEMKLKE